AFAEALGYHLDIADGHRVLDLPATLPEAPPRDGYTLIDWRGRMPQEWIDQYAEMMSVFVQEAPTGEHPIENEFYDATRVRADEQRLIDQGRIMQVVAAVSPDGRMAGITQLVFPDADPRDVYQWATLVLPAHRGHGLGLTLKVRAMVVAAELLARAGVRLSGDLLVNTITDEESSGAGGIASVARGVRADGGIVPEPTDFEVWVACRGSVYPTITVEGRPGHAELRQPHWRDGGAVNAIEKAQVVLDAVRRLREEWLTRADLQHPYLSPPDIVPTVMAAGEWAVTYPASCEITCAVLFPPALADDAGYGSRVRRDVEAWIRRACDSDPWLADHPPSFSWTADIPPMEIPPDAAIVQTVLAASADVGEPSRLGGLDSWYDGATYTMSAGTPSVGFGPRSIHTAHTIDEHVAVDDLVRCAQAIALAAMRFCDTA
ncbi:MAG: acetylornithine deacetylase, partial [Gaiellales bacterium]|nr:acetylornithine deacetylase [Gaiellales bacterium]